MIGMKFNNRIPIPFANFGSTLQNSIYNYVFAKSNHLSTLHAGQIVLAFNSNTIIKKQL